MTTTLSAEEMERERETYEQACRDRAISYGRVYEDHYFKYCSEREMYISPGCQLGWEVWQQARATFARHPQPECGEVASSHLEVALWTREQDLADSDPCVFASRYGYEKTGYTIALCRLSDAQRQISEHKRLLAERDALLREALEAMTAAHESMFEQCLSNPIRNAWGQEVNVSKINDLQVAASRIRAALTQPSGGKEE